VSFSTLLVANRGEIARRVLRAGHAAGLRCVAVYVPADANAPFVADADVAVPLGGDYLDEGAILAAAAHSGAEAIHPGYGFLSENAGFAEAVEAAGLIWVGPPSRVIAAMGDKLEAKGLASAAGIPLLPSSEDPRDARSLGYPLIVKAAGGGGGKGMRVVRAASQLDEAIAAAQREAQVAFHDDRVFIERYVARARHVEFQIIADAHGHVVHLGERDCSVQRRHQKLIEESPSPVLTDVMRKVMGASAVELARAIGYQSVGTVEFLVDDETHDFYFLEVNARLQVEHPVTEEVTGLDLVQAQLRVAQGEPLGFTQDDLRSVGSAIEVRLCAEDPRVGFLPASGTLAAFEPSREPHVRWESGVRRGSKVTVDFDPLLAKVIAHAPTRTEAASTLAFALERLHLGGVVTNRDFLSATLRNEHFLAGETTTDFIERFDPPRELTLSEEELAFCASAGALWLQEERRAGAPVLREVPSGWRNARLPRQRTTLRLDDRVIDVDYARRRDGSFDVSDHSRARVHASSDTALDVEVDGVRRVVRVTRSGDHLYVQSVSSTIDFVLVARFSAQRAEGASGGLRAPMPGMILDVRVDVGQRIETGDALVVIEAMKMEHVVTAPYAGTVTRILVAKDQQVERGSELLALDVAPTADEA
jgi:propionyl-CoA carboxylase alpha chain